MSPLPKSTAVRSRVLVAILSVALSAVTAVPVRAQGVGQALDLPSGACAYVRVGDHPGLEPQQFTIETWFEPLGTGCGSGGGAAGRFLFAKPSEGSGGSFLSSYSLSWSPDSGLLRFAVATRLGNGAQLISQTAVAAGELAHAAASFDGTTMRIYVNGILDGELDPHFSSVYYGNEDVLMGAANLGSGFLRRFEGTLDDVRLWDHARDEDQVRADMVCKATGLEPGLLGYWHFDQMNLTDATGNGHDGTAVGSQGFVSSQVPAGQSMKYGRGTPGTWRIPKIRVTARPEMGTTVAIQVENSLGLPTLGFVLIGTEARPESTQMADPILVGPDPVRVIPIAVPVTGGSMNLDIPADPALCGMELFLQGGQADPGAIRGQAYTRGLRLIYGD